MDSTIFALSTGRSLGRSGLAVIRVSGPLALQTLWALTGRRKKMLEPRKAVYTALRHDRQLLDRALVLWFPKPNSFTGLDTVEFHVHGAKSVVRDTLAAIAQVPGVRPALAGEFTRQAVETGKLGSTFELEAFADLMKSETSLQRQLALTAASATEHELKRCRETVVRALAFLEADIDFGEEFLDTAADGGGDHTRLLVDVDRLKNRLVRALARADRCIQVRDGFRVCLLGKTNVGKTSLMNALVGRSAGIVSDRPGTTRDIVETSLELAGHVVVLADTAGQRPTDDLVEQEGQLRAQQYARGVQLAVVVVDSDQDARAALNSNSNNSEHVGAGGAGDAAGGGGGQQTTTIVVRNKIDLTETALLSDPSVVPVSCETGQGLDQLVRKIESILNGETDESESLTGSTTAAAAAAANDLLITRTRHRQLIEQTVSALAQFQASSDAAEQAYELRTCVELLSELIGDQYCKEEVLNIIYNEFCIGK